MGSYRITMTYADGSVQEVANSFISVEKAKEHAENLIRQYAYDQSVKGAYSPAIYVKTFYIIKDSAGNVAFDSRIK